MGKQVKINKADAVEMFTAIGFTTANKWTTKRLQSKANRMDTAPDDSLGSKKLDELADLVLSSENILIIDEVEETKKKDTKPKTKVKTVKATVINNKKVKTEKKEKTPKEKKEKKVGIIATLVACMKAKPHSKEQLLAALVKAFPDRPAEGMGKTINIQIPGRLSKDKGLKIKTDDKGRYSID